MASLSDGTTTITFDVVRGIPDKMSEVIEPLGKRKGVDGEAFVKRGKGSTPYQVRGVVGKQKGVAAADLDAFIEDVKGLRDSVLTYVDGWGVSHAGQVMVGDPKVNPRAIQTPVGFADGSSDCMVEIVFVLQDTNIPT